MDLTFKQLEATLTAYLKIKPDSHATFRSRIKQLQRLEFPPGVNIGRGAKMTYGASHLFQMVTAFELISIGIPAMAATKYVEENWSKFSAGYALSALIVLSAQKESKIFAQLSIRSLHELQFGLTAKTPSSITICDAEWLAHALDSDSIEPPLIASILMLSQSYARAVSVAGQVAGVSIPSFDEEILAWLPSAELSGLIFRGPYPDRSNLKMRRHLSYLFGTDMGSREPDAEEEAREFYAEHLDPDARQF